MEEIKSCIEQVYDEAEHHIILSFGLLDNIDKFRLEARAHNIMNFHAPDMRGNMPQDEVISSDMAKNFELSTTLNT